MKWVGQDLSLRFPSLTMCKKETHIITLTHNIYHSNFYIKIYNTVHIRHTSYSCLVLQILQYVIITNDCLYLTPNICRRAPHQEGEYL